MHTAYLAAENGTIFPGKAIGNWKAVNDEVVFNTSITGYHEISTDSSYAKQTITRTYRLMRPRLHDIPKYRVRHQGRGLALCCWQAYESVRWASGRPQTPLATGLFLARSLGSVPWVAREFAFICATAADTFHWEEVLRNAKA